MTSPGSHNETIGYIQVAKDRFEEAFQALTHVQALISTDEDGGTGIWQALNAADESTGGAIGATHAAFNASPNQGAIDRLLRYSQNVNDAVQDTRQLLNQASERAREGRDSALAGVAQAEQIIQELGAVGQ